ncbi:MAG: fructosamine kinase family protein [Rhodospirillales bacterium]|nr:MAG: fructosamine kinase family protein [Rhodospirillales bacterium]
MAVTPAACRAVARAGGAAVVDLRAVSGGCIGEVWCAALEDGRRLAVKTGDAAGSLDVEGYMLDYLARTNTVPVPEVLHAAPDLLVMSWVEADGRLTAAAEQHAAELLAALHGIAAEAYGHERDTLIGALRQPNPWCQSWVAFFREHRLLHIGRDALDCGALARDTYKRLEDFCIRKLDAYIDEPDRPSLIHGDMWGGNVLCADGRIAAFIDPAIYHADAEIELAFSTLFGTYGDVFFRTYDELRPIRPGFFEARRDIYNLYPLLVHTRLFGGHYGTQVDHILKRFL